MPFNGQGVFVPSISFVADQAANIGPQASRFDTNFDDVASGLSNCITRDGQTTITSNLNMSNKKVVNLADATAGQDAVNVRIVQQASKFMYVGASGTGSLMTGSTNPTFTSLVAGMLFMVIVPADSANGGCQFSVNGLAYQNVLSPAAVVSGDFKTNDTLLLLWDGSNYRWINKWRHSDIPVSTYMPFLLPSAPVGWVQLTDIGWNDRMMRLVSTTGQGVGGSWTISGLSTETVAHVHTFSTNTGGPSGTVNYQGPVGGGAISAAPDHVHAIAVSTSAESALHSHTGDGGWRPAYANFIVCYRDI